MQRGARDEGSDGARRLAAGEEPGEGGELREHRVDPLAVLGLKVPRITTKGLGKIAVDPR